MNRPLKFRVWNKKTKSWVKDFALIWEFDRFRTVRVKQKGVCYGHGDDRVDTLIDNEYYPLYTEAEEAQQFTGLTDIHGKDIYEGDLVRVVKESEAWVLAQVFEHQEMKDFQKGRIIWSNSAWFISEKGLGCCWLDRFDDLEGGAALEIVGNVFENE